ncbi:MAG: hypothetical protein WBQ37_03370 [Candidatus Competibacter sp.]
MSCSFGVPGAATHPFYRQLAMGAMVTRSGNFYKYLLDRNGAAVALFPSRTRPDDP